MTRHFHNVAGAAASALILSQDMLFVSALKDAGAPHSRVLNLMSTGQTIEQAMKGTDLTAYSLFIVDIDPKNHDSLQALQKMMIELRGEVPVVVVTASFNEVVARWLLQIRVSDFACKPVEAEDLIKTCLASVQSHHQDPGKGANITTFLPAAGGVGITTLVIEAAFLKHEGTKNRRASTCIVDLNFQHGSCADYLDMEPRLDLTEIENAPERLDKQLMDVMLNYHSTGVAVIAAPTRPAEMRSFDPALVTRLLDLAATHFDNVVIDMPRTWFAWTDDVLLGSDNIFVVTEMTVPGLRHAQRLVKAVEDRLDPISKPRVIVNRFTEKNNGPALKRSDVEVALGQHFAGTIPNNYQLVREAIDRGVPLEAVKPGNPVSTELRKIISPEYADAVSKQNNKGLAIPFKNLFAR